MSSALRHARVANCACGESAACYACLRSYRNQFCHDLLARGPVADYLNRLIESFSQNPEDDRLYDLPDRTGVVRAALRDNARVDLVASCLTDAGPPEASPWYVQLLEFASRPNTQLRLAVAELPSVRSTAEVALFSPYYRPVLNCTALNKPLLPPYIPCWL